MALIPACLVSPQQLPLTSTLLQGGALGVLAQLQLSVLGQLHQRGGLSLLVLFALAAVVAAVRLPLPLLLLLPAGGRRRLLRAVVDDILLLLDVQARVSHECMFQVTANNKIIHRKVWILWTFVGFFFF